MHNKVKEAITNCLTEYEVQVKAKIPMDVDFLAMLLTVKVVEELQTKEAAPAARAPRKPKEEGDGKQKELSVISGLGSLAGGNKA